MKICIGSKNREPIILKWLTEFDKSEILLFVEPQEFEKYNSLYSSKVMVINIQENDKRFGYLLDFINKFICSNFEDKYWLFLDDDILGFEERIEDLKLKKTTDNKVIKNIFFEMLERTKEENLSQLGMSFNVHNRFNENEIDYNKGCWCCIINKSDDIENVGGYDKNLIIFSDWEISARLISKGYKTGILYNYAFNHQMKSKKGGAEFIYKNNLTKSACDYIKNIYGDVCDVKFNEPHKQYEVRFKWSKLKTSKNKLLIKTNLFDF